jgi:hypothetical protein
VAAGLDGLGAEREELALKGKDLPEPAFRVTV